MKAWWTAREIADAKLPGFPEKNSALYNLIKREAWTDDLARCRKREGRGGGLEYDYTLFPPEARAELARRWASQAALEEAQARRALVVAGAGGTPALPAPVPVKGSPQLIAAGLDRQDAKLQILAAFDRFWAAVRGTLGREGALHKFAGLWSAGEIEAEPWVRTVRRQVSAQSLRRWLAAREAGEPARLAGHYGNREGSGVFNRVY